MHVKRLLPVLIALATCALPCGAYAGRALLPEDWYRFQPLSDLQIAPDGTAVAYLVTTYDKEADESKSALWITDWVHAEGVQLTRGESVTDPRFSPDGRYLSFLAARPPESAAQLWLLDRRGGEARAVGHVTGEIAAYEWSPDGAHVVLVMHGEGEPASDGKAPGKTRPAAGHRRRAVQAGQGGLSHRRVAHAPLSARCAHRRLRGTHERPEPRGFRAGILRGWPRDRLCQQSGRERADLGRDEI